MNVTNRRVNMNKKELIDKLAIYQDDFLSHQIIHLARQAEGDNI